jgi:hypothetical protein
MTGAGKVPALCCLTPGSANGRLGEGGFTGAVPIHGPIRSTTQHSGARALIPPPYKLAVPFRPV